MQQATNTVQFSLDDILNFETRFRASFINALGAYKTPVLIGTCDSYKNTNLAIFNSQIHIGANPPLVGLIVRPDSVERHTLQNILDTKSYTINHITPAIYKQAHQTSARYAKNQSEFNEVGLTPEYKEGIIAPFVKESTIKIALDFVEKIDLTINGTILVIGKVNFVSLPKSSLHQDGFVDLVAAESIASVGLDAYYTANNINRLSYAKPDKPAQEINSNLID
jgi:flavin reductase (DIM6/NTAB) family NADH-FMN oxidoreductase RutF